MLTKERAIEIEFGKDIKEVLIMLNNEKFYTCSEMLKIFNDIFIKNNISVWKTTGGVKGLFKKHNIKLLSKKDNHRAMQNIVKGAKKQWEDEEFKKMQSEKAKKQWEDKEFRNKITSTSRKTLKDRWENDIEFVDKIIKINRENMIKKNKNDDFREKAINGTKKSWLEGKHIKHCEKHSEYMKEKWKNNKEYRESMTGKNNPSYNPNLTDEERFDKRLKKEDREFRKVVLKRDNHTCQVCGKNSGQMIAHHKDSHNWCKEKRTDINNGVTLCEECHKAFHKKYGYGNNTEKQFIEFKKSLI